MSEHDDIIGDLNQVVTGGFRAVGRYAVIGHPVAQSESPQLHNAWFKAMGRPGTYVALDIDPEALVHRGPSLPFEFSGLNVTVPHKVAMMGHAKRIDSNAEAAGATNVLYRDEDQQWTAGNTDGRGFIAALEEELSESVMGKDVVILGAGGAARAIGAALVQAGVASLWIANRTKERAEAVVEAIGGSGVAPLHAEVLDILEVAVDLVVNTLPPAAEALVGSLDLAPLGDHAALVDINYYMRDPALLQIARSAGLLGLDGRGMFLWQAALSFEHWCGELPDMHLGRRILRMD
jgi:shikimate dehydrogenase